MPPCVRSRVVNPQTKKQNYQFCFYRGCELDVWRGDSIAEGPWFLDPNTKTEMDTDQPGGQAPQRLGIFSGAAGLFVSKHVQPQRLQIWKTRFRQLGGVVEEGVSRSLTHIFALQKDALLERVEAKRLKKLQALPVKYEWIEGCLKAGSLLPVEDFIITVVPEADPTSGLVDLSLDSQVESDHSQSLDSPAGQGSDADDATEPGRALKSPKREDTWMAMVQQGAVAGLLAKNQQLGEDGSNERVAGRIVESVEQRSTASVPPNLNREITSQFDELRGIYKDALGDDRRSFSYYKAVSALEKLPFKITNVNQVKGLPSIGKGLQDHISEILETGTLSKLEHFRTDEKVRTISLFGSVWGIGPATALRLYEKGYRTVKDVVDDPSLTAPQRLGAIYHDDITKRIPRNEVTVMEALVQQAAESIRPGIVVVCGGSYRRGKSTVGDMDIVITHPDGRGHTGFLRLLVQRLKEMDFLTEDLLFGEHSVEGTDSGVDTYFGLCKYPGREQRHRIDLKVYPYDQYPFGLIAWTGNDVLNRRLRLIAESKGFKMDDHGLFPVLRDSTGRREAQRHSGVRCRSEREVFDALDFPWLEPEERNL